MKKANENRLIDANALDRKSCFVITAKAISKVRQIVYAMKNVDAVEVVHGEWVVCGDGEYVPFMCSACGKTTSWYHKQTANYCPNCGAKMDLKGE